MTPLILSLLVRDKIYFVMENIVVYLKSKCRCVTEIYQDYNNAKTIDEYLKRVKQAMELQTTIVEHEENCSVFNGEFNQFFTRGTR